MDTGFDVYNSTGIELFNTGLYVPMTVVTVMFWLAALVIILPTLYYIYMKRKIKKGQLVIFVWLKTGIYITSGTVHHWHIAKVDIDKTIKTLYKEENI